MSASITTAYQSIAPYKLYLNLTDSEIDFYNTQNSKCKNKNYSKDYATINDKSLLYCENDKINNNKHISNYKYGNNVITRLLDDTRFKNFIDQISKYNLENIVSSNSVTIFVPVTNIDQIYDFKYFPKKIMLNHLVDGIINPIDIIDKKVTIEMMSKLSLKMNCLQILDDSKKSNRVLQSINCKNAFIYIIENPIILNIY